MQSNNCCHSLESTNRTLFVDVVIEEAHIYLLLLFTCEDSRSERSEDTNDEGILREVTDNLVVHQLDTDQNQAKHNKCIHGLDLFGCLGGISCPEVSKDAFESGRTEHL